LSKQLLLSSNMNDQCSRRHQAVVITRKGQMMDQERCTVLLSQFTKPFVDSHASDLQTTAHNSPTKLALQRASRSPSENWGESHALHRHRFSLECFDNTSCIYSTACCTHLGAKVYQSLSVVRDNPTGKDRMLGSVRGFENDPLNKPTRGTCCSLPQPLGGNVYDHLSSVFPRATTEDP
jgi:hypothetical protein